MSDVPDTNGTGRSRAVRTIVCCTSEERQGFARELTDELRRRGIDVEPAPVVADLALRFDDAIAEARLRAAVVVVLGRSLMDRIWPRRALNEAFAARAPHPVLAVLTDIEERALRRHSPAIGAWIMGSASDGAARVTDGVLDTLSKSLASGADDQSPSVSQPY